MIYPRVTNKLISENVVSTLNGQRSKLNELNQQIATGKMISKPSDNPTGAINILSTNTSLNKIDTYKKNIEAASSEVDATGRATLSLSDVLQRVKELTIKAADATSGSSELTSINDELKQIIEQVKDVANSQFGNKYIFGGLETETAPYVKTGTNGDEVKYIGTPSSGPYQRETEIGENLKINVNISGDNIFGEYYTDTSKTPATVVSSGIIGTLKELSLELEPPIVSPAKTAVPADHNKIREKLTNIDDSLQQVLSSQASVGGLSSRLEMTKNKLEEDAITLTKFKSTVEDIDLPKAISDLSFQQTALQTSLSVSAKVMQTSLLQYLSL
jgi:flagellar hook-associated protein 3 FlgL